MIFSNFIVLYIVRLVSFRDKYSFSFCIFIFSVKSDEDLISLKLQFPEDVDINL